MLKDPKVTMVNGTERTEYLGENAIEKITHYVKLKNIPELTGYYDSPRNKNLLAKNPSAECSLSKCYYSMNQSKNAILMERAKLINYSKKYYSYVLIVEDEQQPELVGKVMIYQFGKTIKEKILAEDNGEYGERCNVYSPVLGKDFILIVKEIETGDDTYPDYKLSSFKGERSSLPIYKDGKFKNVPTTDGKIDPKFNSIIREFLLNREFELEEFEAKPLSDQQQSKINDIIAYMTGKASSNYQKESPMEAKSEDFDFDSVMTETPSKSSNTVEDEDDFFGDI